tara:strand:- start:5632 stop:7689 length:2058 start_codon:yes stop_codon:yes gene_type:complete
MSRGHGLRAFDRVSTFDRSREAVQAAAAAAYPSSVLTLDASAPQALIATTEEPQRYQLSTDPGKRAARMRLVEQRMAALRLDWDRANLDVQTAPDTALAQAMNTLNLTVSGYSALSPTAYYVPYGHGHAPPRLVYPPVPTPMFGSVPVWLEDVDAVVAQLQSAIVMGNGTSGATVLDAWIVPTFPCNSDGYNERVRHPSVLEVTVGPTVRRIDFWASEPELVPSQLSNATKTSVYADAKNAAVAHKQDEASRQLASRVSTLAWNAERVMQALLLAASLGKGTNGATLVIGDGVPRTVLRKRETATAEAQRQRLLIDIQKKQGDVKFYAERHYRELRETFDKVERLMKNPRAYLLANGLIMDTGAGNSASTSVSAVAVGGSLSYVRIGQTRDSERAEVATGVLFEDALAWLRDALPNVNPLGGDFAIDPDLERAHAAAREAARRDTRFTDPVPPPATPSDFGSQFVSVKLPFADRESDAVLTKDEELKNLKRLRNRTNTTLDALNVPDKADVWKPWAVQCERIQYRAEEAFLNEPEDANLVKEHEKALAFIKSTKRGSDVDYLRDILLAHVATWEGLEKDLEELDVAIARRADEAVAEARRVHAHMVAAALVGGALARGVLGSADTPALSRIRMASYPTQVIPEDVRRVLSAVVENVRLDLQNTAGHRASALRLSELCAITQQRLP